MIERLRKIFLKNRLKVLYDIFDLDGYSILDLGGYDGKFMDSIKEKYPNIKVTIADQDEEGLAISGQKGYDTILLDGAKKMPFSDLQFDLVFCNSVIEHVTIPKDEMWDLKSGFDFKERSLLIQKHFANEIARIGKSYFVQTPNRYFLMEHHMLVPFAQFLPRNALINFIKFTNKFWIKKTIPDWNLLSSRQLKQLFPDAKIIKEKVFFMNKSIIAYRNQSVFMDKK